MNNDYDPTLIETLWSSQMVLEPVAMRRLFFMLSSFHFSDPDNFGDVPESYKRFVYTPNAKDSSVRIFMDYNYDENNLHTGSNIYVGLTDFNFNVAVLDSYSQSSDDRATTSSVDRARSVLILRHVSKDPDEALTMAVLHAGFYRGFRDKIKKHFNFDTFDVANMTQPRLLKSDGKDRRFRVDINVNLGFECVWNTNVESHRIKNVEIDVEAFVPEEFSNKNKPE